MSVLRAHIQGKLSEHYTVRFIDISTCPQGMADLKLKTDRKARWEKRCPYSSPQDSHSQVHVETVMPSCGCRCVVQMPSAGGILPHSGLCHSCVRYVQWRKARRNTQVSVSNWKDNFFINRRKKQVIIFPAPSPSRGDQEAPTLGKGCSLGYKWLWSGPCLLHSHAGKGVEWVSCLPLDQLSVEIRHPSPEAAGEAQDSAESWKSWEQRGSNQLWTPGTRDRPMSQGVRGGAWVMWVGSKGSQPGAR